jgi:hypothetical protein
MLHVGTRTETGLQTFIHVTDDNGNAANPDPNVPKAFSFNGTLEDEPFFGSVETTFNGYLMHLTLGVTPISTDHRIEISRADTFRSYTGMVPANRRLDQFFAEFKSFWRYEGAINVGASSGTIDDLDGSTKKNGRLTLAWGSKRLIADSVDNGSGNVVGSVHVQGASQEFSGGSSGTMRNILFTDPDHVVLWLLGFFVR